MLKSCWFSLWQSRWYVSQLHWTLSFGLLDDREDFKVMSWWPGMYSYYLIKCISRKNVYVYICFQCWYLFIISKQALLHVLLSLTFIVLEDLKIFSVAASMTYFWRALTRSVTWWWSIMTQWGTIWRRRWSTRRLLWPSRL